MLAAVLRRLLHVIEISQQNSFPTTRTYHLDVGGNRVISGISSAPITKRIQELCYGPMDRRVLVAVRQWFFAVYPISLLTGLVTIDSDVTKTLLQDLDQDQKPWHQHTSRDTITGHYQE